MDIQSFDQLFLKQDGNDIKFSLDGQNWTTITQLPINIQSLTNNNSKITIMSNITVDKTIITKNESSVINTPIIIDGNGYEITVNSTAFEGICIGNKIRVVNMGAVVNGYIKDGAICGNSCSGIVISNCYSRGAILSGGGGICGSGCNNITINNCFSTKSIGENGGGICGSLCSGVISNCYSTGGIDGNFSGGICGSSCLDMTISNCYSTGNILGNSAGGICGSGCSRTTISNSYSTGNIYGAGSGSICGSNCTLASVTNFGAIGRNSNNLVTYYGTSSSSVAFNDLSGDYSKLIVNGNYLVVDGKYYPLSFNGQIYSSANTVIVSGNRTQFYKDDVSTGTVNVATGAITGNVSYVLYAEELNGNLIDYIIQNMSNTYVADYGLIIIKTNEANKVVYEKDNVETELVGSTYFSNAAKIQFNSNVVLPGFISVRDGCEITSNVSYEISSSSNYIISGNCLSINNIHAKKFLCAQSLIGNIFSNCFYVGNGATNYAGICSDGSRSIEILNCYVIGSTTDSGSGKLCGSNCVLVNITNCYTIGDIGGTNSGGICGSNCKIMTIKNCYTKGTVNASSGGIIGGNYEGTITNCYSDNREQPSGSSVTTTNTGTDDIEKYIDMQFYFRAVTSSGGDVNYILKSFNIAPSESGYQYFSDRWGKMAYQNGALANNITGFINTVKGTLQSGNLIAYSYSKTTSRIEKTFELKSDGYYDSLDNKVGEYPLYVSTGASFEINQDFQLTQTTPIIIRDDPQSDNNDVITLDGGKHTITYNGIDIEGLISGNYIKVQNIQIKGTETTTIKQGYSAIFSKLCTNIQAIKCGVYIPISNNSGGICGSECSYIDIDLCFSTGDIDDGGGGITGYMCSDIMIENCYSIGNIKYGAGGICGGYTETAQISKCYSLGTLQTGGSGICGNNCNIITISECYSSGTNSNGQCGICGPRDSSKNGAINISNCYIKNFVNGFPISGDVNVTNSGGYIYNNDNITLSGNSSTKIDFEGFRTIEINSISHHIISIFIDSIYDESFSRIISRDAYYAFAGSTGTVDNTTGVLSSFTGDVIATNIQSNNLFNYVIQEDIDSPGLSTMYIRMNGENFQTSADNSTWVTVTQFPIFIDKVSNNPRIIFNTNTTLANINSAIFERRDTTSTVVIDIDGGGYEITFPSSSAVDGVFNGQYAIVHDLYVKSINIASEGGGICGLQSSNVTVRNCGVVSHTRAETSGGICGGRCTYIVIDKCYAIGDIPSTGGGLCGILCSNMIIENSYSVGSVGSEGGGACGKLCSNGVITNCYSIGNIGQEGGGICGKSSNTFTINNCYSVGSTSANAGGIYGLGSTNITVPNYKLIETSSAGVPDDSIELGNSRLDIAGKYIEFTIGGKIQYLLAAFNGSIYDSSNTPIILGKEYYSDPSNALSSIGGNVNANNGYVNVACGVRSGNYLYDYKLQKIDTGDNKTIDSTLYIKDDDGQVKQSTNNTTWSNAIFPINFTSSNSNSQIIFITGFVCADDLLFERKGTDSTAVVVKGNNYNVISKSANFNGIIKGNYITVNDVKLECNSIASGGICAAYSNNITVKNCSVIEGSFKNNGCGAICGNNCDNINIQKCYSIIASNGVGCGGICGDSCSNIIVKDCYSHGVISHSGGGISGSNCSGTITECYSTGNIGDEAGGICGKQCSNMIIKNCYSIGNVTAGSGSICGYNCSNINVSYCIVRPGTNIVGSANDGGAPSSVTTSNMGSFESDKYIEMNINGTDQYLLLAFNGTLYDSNLSPLNTNYQFYSDMSNAVDTIGGIINISSGTISVAYGEVFNEEYLYNYIIQRNITITDSSEEHPPIASICLRGDTEILTDQGAVFIKKLSSKYTIDGYRIQKVTRAILPDSEIVCIPKGVLGCDRDLFISLNHLVFDGLHLYEAKDIQGGKKIKYMGEIMYNIVLDIHGLIRANGVTVETLYPMNPHAL